MREDGLLLRQPESIVEYAELEEAWAIEVERRIADIESGAVQVIPIAEALAQVRAAAIFSADFPTTSSIKSPLMNFVSLR